MAGHRRFLLVVLAAFVLGIGYIIAGAVAIVATLTAAAWVGPHTGFALQSDPDTGTYLTYSRNSRVYRIRTTVVYLASSGCVAFGALVAWQTSRLTTRRIQQIDSDR